MSKTILVVDDQRIQRVLLRAILEEHEFRVLEASNGQEAIDIFTQNEIDVIITDLIMPGISGLELCEKLLEIRPEAKIFAISGGIGKIQGGADEYLKLARLTGAVRAFSKPIDADEIIEALKSA